ncbi:hypothetical protein Tco_0347097, partial [Tanacetum coccineum]
MEGFRATLKPPIDYTLCTNRKMVPDTFLDVLDHYFWKWKRFEVFWERYDGGNSSSRVK